GGGDFQWPQPAALDHVVLGLEDLHPVIADGQAHAGIGNVLQLLGDQPVEGLGTVLRQLPAQLTVDIAQRDAAIDHVGTVRLRVDIVDGRQHVGGEFTNDLFEDVLQRDQADHVAVFIHYEADPTLLFLKVHQLGVQRRILGNEVGFPAGLDEVFPGQLVAAQQSGNGPHVDQAGNVVDIAAKHRQPGVVAGAQLLQDGRHVVVQVNAVGLVARHHDVIDRHALHVENAQQHVLASGRDAQTRFVDHGTQLVGTELGGLGALQGYAEQPQQAVAECVAQPYHGIEHSLQQGQDNCHAEGYRLRTDGGEGLRRDLAKDQDHDGEQHSGDGDSRIAPDPGRHHGSDRGGQNVDDVIAYQNGAEQPVGPGEHSLGSLSGAVALLAQVPETVAVEAHHGRLGAGEERRAGDQQGKYQEKQTGACIAQGLPRCGVGFSRST